MEDLLSKLHKSIIGFFEQKSRKNLSEKELEKLMLSCENTGADKVFYNLDELIQFLENDENFKNN